jgi:DNA-binding winged helix-turn-helix (wHTH) protein
VTLRYRIDDTLIDLDTREIRRGDGLVDVEAKVFDLIALLLKHRDRALDKRELSAALWGDRPVTDAALSQQLRKARRALGDDGDAQRVIRTVHGRGLRWVAAVEEIDDRAGAEPVAATPASEPVAEESVPASSATAARSLRSRRPLAVSVIALIVLLALLVVVAFAARWFAPQSTVKGATDATRIAILPLDDQTAEPSLEWTRTGLMGLMASLFGQDPRIDVAAAKDVLAVDAGARALDAAGAKQLRDALGATHLVATRLRRVGPLYELDVSLLGAGLVERRQTLHGSAPAPLAVDAVAQLRRWLDLDALPDVRNRAIGPAFLAEAYARGVGAQLHGDYAGARKYFEICLEQDPGLAWARLGLSVAQGATGDTQASADNANTVAATAREQGNDELLVAALRQLGSLAFRRGDLDAAAQHVDAALAQMSETRALGLIDLLVADASIEDERGHFERSRAQFERALALAREIGSRHGEALVLVNLAILDNGAGNAAAAAAQLRAGLDAARESGDSSLEGNTLANLGGTETNQGHLLDAVSLLKQALLVARARSDTHLEVLTTIQLIWALAPFGRDTDIERLAHTVEDAAPRDQNPYWQAELNWVLGVRAARRGIYTDAVARLERARALYAEAGMVRNLAPVLADIVEIASAQHDAPRAHEAAKAFREIADADARAWAAWLPLIDAQLRWADGDSSGALAALTERLDRAPDAAGAAAQASLFQLGRWQITAGRYDDLLARTAWQPWLAQHPEAIALRVAALRASGKTAEAEAEQARVDALKQAPQLELEVAADSAH